MIENIFKEPKFLDYKSNIDFLIGKTVGITGHRGVLGQLFLNSMKDKDIIIKTYDYDIIDYEKLEVWFNNNHFDYLFHFAAKVPVNYVNDNYLEAYEINTISIYYILKFINNFQKKCWFFYCSSSHVYTPNLITKNIKLNEANATQPYGLYGKTKLDAENIILSLAIKLKINFCIGRIFSYTHSTQKEPYLVPTLINRIRNLTDNEELELYNGSSIRDIMNAQSVVKSIFELTKLQYNGIINIGSGIPISVKEITILILNNLNKKNIKIKCIDKKIDSIVADVSKLRFLLSKKNKNPYL